MTSQLVRKTFVVLVAALVAVVPATVHSLEIFSTDFSSIPAELNVNGSGTPYTTRPFDHIGTGVTYPGPASNIDVSAQAGLTGQWLFTPTGGNRNAIVTLNGLAPHTTLSLDMFLAPGGGIDGGGDNLEIKVDGVTIFNNGFGGRFPDRPGYGDTPVGVSTTIVPKLNAANSGVGASNFIDYRTGAWGHDALYDLGLDPALQNIPHTASTATIELITNRNEGNTDEYFGIANLVISDNSVDIAVPEPRSLSLLGIAVAALAGFGWRRYRRAA